jgi:hypothetical protein
MTKHAGKRDEIQKDLSSWVRNLWRPAMAWQYLFVCLFDFVIGPVLTFVFAGHTGTDLQQWHPLTLQGSGLYHIAMGAVVGVNVYSRMQEKNKIIDHTFKADDDEDDREERRPRKRRREKEKEDGCEDGDELPHHADP